MSDTNRLNEIRYVLLKSRDTAEYNMGSPRALDHLLVHVVALIEALIEDQDAPTNTTLDEQESGA